MIKVIDHLKEREGVLQRNLVRIVRGLHRGEEVMVLHPIGKIHKRLTNIPGVIYKEWDALGKVDAPKPKSKTDKSLFEKLTRIGRYMPTYKGEPYGEIFIHWHFMDRVKDDLLLCELFHINMLRYFDIPNRVKRIHIRCTAKKETNAIICAKAYLRCGSAELDFKLVPPNDRWEHDTIKEAAEYAVKTGEFIYYTHFKGVSRIADPLLKGGLREGYGALDVFYWCWLLYKGLFEAPANTKAIGPMLRGGINKSYSYNKIDISWSALRGALYHYVGSFQGFNGRALQQRFDALNLHNKQERNKKIWIGDKYTVEMFLSLIYPRSDVYTSYIVGPLSDYNLYSKNKLPQYKKMFQQIYMNKQGAAPQKINNKYAVITYLYGDHMLLRGPLVIDENVAYICVTDNKNFKAPKNSVWQVVYDPYDEFSGRFRHMNAKFRPFRYTTAVKALCIDSSIQITESVLPLFELESKGVLLKRHSAAKNIKEELGRWIKLRGMKPKEADRFEKMAVLVGASAQSVIYGGDVTIWDNSERAAYFGESVLHLVEGAGGDTPFMSNQLCISALAADMFKDIISVLPKQLPMKKYHHHSWREIKDWMWPAI